VEGRGLLVTGTDTGVGKTLVSCALLHAFAARGLKAVGMKPVAAGGVERDCRLEYEDVVALGAASNVAAPPEHVNPYRFEPAIAPHIAADLAGESITIERIRDSYEVLRRQADRVVVEGAGGLLVPLGRDIDFTHLARALELPVVLVVGMRLGCLNHALLTAQVLQHHQLRLAGWVANTLDPAMPEFDANVRTLETRLAAPLVAVIPFGPPASAAIATRIDCDRLGL
jgi:dethiobiotin synthetase